MGNVLIMIIIWLYGTRKALKLSLPALLWEEQVRRLVFAMYSYNLQHSDISQFLNVLVRV